MMMKIILFADFNFHYSSNPRVSEPSYSYYSDPSHSRGDLIAAEMEHGGTKARRSTEMFIAKSKKFDTMCSKISPCSFVPAGARQTCLTQQAGLPAGARQTCLTQQAGLRVKTDPTRHITNDSNKRRAHIISHLAEKFNGTTR